MSIETAALTDTGQERPHNEDTVYTGTIDEGVLLAVADGMGGHQAGDVASEKAIETFVDYLETRDTIDNAADVLIQGVKTANRHLHEMADQNTELGGMGTTLVAAYLVEGTATIVNVGDSRAYHVTSREIEKITKDQSLVQELVEQGSISPEEASEHPQKNVLSQALGTDEMVEPDTYSITIRGTLLLCSDGLSDEVPEAEIKNGIMSTDSPSESAAVLVERANQYDGSDNISVVLGST